LQSGAAGAATGGDSFQAGCKVYRTSAQSIPNIITTAVAWDSEDWDPNGMHTGSGSTVTPGVAGKYLVTANFEWAANSLGYRYAQLKQSSTVVAVERESPLVTAVTNMTLTTIMDLSASDTVELDVFQNSGGALNIGGTTKDQASLTLQRIN